MCLSLTHNKEKHTSADCNGQKQVIVVSPLRYYLKHSQMKSFWIKYTLYMSVFLVGIDQVSDKHESHCLTVARAGDFGRAALFYLHAIK